MVDVRDAVGVGHAQFLREMVEYLIAVGDSKVDELLRPRDGRADRHGVALEVASERHPPVATAAVAVAVAVALAEELLVLRVVASVLPILAPPTFCSTSLSARPTDALARKPLPSAPCAWLKPSATRPGPLITTTGVAPIVVAWTPWRLYSCESIDSMAAMTQRKWRR